MNQFQEVQCYSVLSPGSNQLSIISLQVHCFPSTFRIKNSVTSSNFLQARECEAFEPDWLIAAGDYLGFCSMKWLWVFLLPLDRMLVHCRPLPCNLLGFPTIAQYPFMHLSVTVKCLVQEHNTVSPAKAQPGLFDLGMSALAMRPLCLLQARDPRCS